MQVGPAYVGSNAAWVAPATRADGALVVLKLNWPEDRPGEEKEAEHEGLALRMWDGRGAARLIDEDPERHALLLERIIPGDQLWDVTNEVAANEIACDVLDRLWSCPVPSGQPFRRVEDVALRWANEAPAEWEHHGRPIARGLMERAQGILRDLATTQPDSTLLHQDFHGGNILRSDLGSWLTIDPKPLVGERAFDLASLIRDRRPELLVDPDPVARLRQRLDQLVDRLQLDRERVLGWSIAHAVAWGWPEPDMLRCAEWLAEL